MQHHHPKPNPNPYLNMKGLNLNFAFAFVGKRPSLCQPSRDCGREEESQSQNKSLITRANLSWLIEIMQAQCTHRYIFSSTVKWKNGYKKIPKLQGNGSSQGGNGCAKQWAIGKEKDPKFGAAYDKRSIDHNERHKGAKLDLVELLNRNGRRSYTSIGKALNNWCSASTIERFFKSQPDYLTYSQNVRPLLSEGNRMKQVEFSKHVQNRWGLGAGIKILWTMR